MTTRNRLISGLTILALAVFGLFSQGDVGAASLTSRVELTVTGKLSNVLDLSTAEAPLASRLVLDLSNGTGANQANVIWSDRRTLATGATEDIDLAGGGLVDAFGVAVAPARLRAVAIASASANTTTLTLLGDVNSVPILGTAATTIVLKPGGFHVFSDPSTAGILVTAGTGDIIQVVNAAGASATYDIIVIGASS